MLRIYAQKKPCTKCTRLLKKIEDRIFYLVSEYCQVIKLAVIV